MRQREQVVGQDPVAEAELTLRAAAGDLAAFEELYRRHVEAAWRVALAVTANPDDAADAVSDAFTRVFQALPDRLQAADYFLPYLLVAVRNAAIDVLRRRGRQRSADPNEAYDWSVLGAEPAELMVAGTDAALVARAFRSLPERWRSVLWLTEVEGIPAREVAGLLGVSANGVAQLAVRARAGLRQRFLQAHLRQTEVRTSCRHTVDRLGAYAAGALAPRDISKVDQHLAGCETCRSRLDQLEDLAPALRRAVLPLPAGLATLVLGKWGAAFSGASGATDASSATATSASSATLAGGAGPVGVGVGAVALGVPATFATSFASVALLVAGIVGVGVVGHQRQAPAAVANAPEPSFGPAAAAAGDTRPSPAAEHPIAGLVDEGNRAAADLAALTDNLVGSLPAALPEMEPPDAAELERIAQGQHSVDVKAISISADPSEGTATCPSMRMLGAHVGCQSPEAPLERPEPRSEPAAAVAAADEAAARAHESARDRAETIASLPPS